MRARAGRGNGYSLMALAACALVAALLAGLLLARMLEYRALLERAAAMQVVSAARTAMAVRVARLAGHGGQEALEALAQENPVTWLASSPKNYQGEFYRPDAGAIKPGHWYFDRADKTINFLQSSDTFSPETSKLLKFKVELLRELEPADNQGRNEAILGLVLGQVVDRVASNHH
ncbi:hypothetical protein [Massilia sp. H6]|uniref:hypothetical protein n=1 Tax=Massilia sp. H6 TaxID=2970464 RepID=UPI002167D36F|nr:hypothetical protein [Massilia sp. H6]UVW26934.1 hypothetical protein NRS07_10110 [Massilia sp. H6]